MPSSASVLGAMPLAGMSEAGDAAGSVATAASMDVGTIFDGTIGTSSDSDWIEVTLEAGETYVFLAWGTGGQSAGLADTTLALRDATGAELRRNDDISSGDNHFSSLSLTPGATGTYYVDVASQDGGTGQYRVVATPDIAPAEIVATYMTEIDWGLPMPLRFAAETARLTVDLTALTQAGRQLARWALEAWEVVTGIGFVEDAASAQIIFDDERDGAFAGPASYNAQTGINGLSEVNVGTGWLDSYGTSRDSYGFQTYLHEIGHALGLAHAGPYDGSATYGSDNIFRNDSSQLTVMSYFDPDDNPVVGGDDVTILTPMTADILAMEALYGPVAAYSGDTVWGANSNVGGTLGEAFAILYDGVAADGAFWQGLPVAYTIFDTGGRDTLDLSTVSVAQAIDLARGGVSNAGGIDGGIVIATGTVIEDAIGGSGDDTIRGNEADNRLTGGPGDDRLVGGGGTDTAVFAVARASARIREVAGGVEVVSAEGIDMLIGVERFAFTDRTATLSELLGEPEPAPLPQPTPVVETDPDPVFEPDPDPLSDGREPEPETPIVVMVTGPEGLRLAGTSGDDILAGTAFDDTITGEGGADLVEGYGGDDLLSASDGDDTVFGGDGDDMIGGGYGDDRIDAGEGDDTVGGGRGDDTVSGGEGDDILNGGAGRDSIDGGAGNDTSGAGYQDDVVSGGEGDDSLGGGAGADNLTGGDGHDEIGGGVGNDLIEGGAGNDFLAGGAGADVLDGGPGSDRLNGGAGNDVLTGGGGADLFVLNELNAGEVDTIADFEAGLDRIRIEGIDNAPGSGLQGYLDALGPTDIDGGLELSAAGHVLRLTGVSAAEIGIDDFLFA